jgi:hypothetical protein
MKVTRTIGVATMLPAGGLFAKATNCPLAQRLPGVGELNDSKGRSNHRTGSVAPKKVDAATGR